VAAEEAFRTAFAGRFKNLLRWADLETLWQRIQTDADGGWFVYAIGEPPPARPAGGAEVADFLTAIDELLRREHTESYCGIVFVDNLEMPAFVKIFDPNNLGMVCGSSGQPPLPGWIMSKLPPCELQAAVPLANNRRRLWQRLFGNL